MPLSDRMSIQPVNLQCWPERSSIFVPENQFPVDSELREDDSAISYCALLF